MLSSIVVLVLIVPKKKVQGSDNESCELFLNPVCLFVWLEPSLAIAIIHVCTFCVCQNSHF